MTDAGLSPWRTCRRRFGSRAWSRPTRVHRKPPAPTFRRGACAALRAACRLALGADTGGSDQLVLGDLISGDDGVFLFEHRHCGARASRRRAFVDWLVGAGPGSRWSASCHAGRYAVRFAAYRAAPPLEVLAAWPDRPACGLLRIASRCCTWVAWRVWPQVQVWKRNRTEAVPGRRIVQATDLRQGHCGVKSPGLAVGQRQLMAEAV
jgi:hypothetical protein